MNKLTKFGLLLTSLALIASVLVTTVNAQPDSPYSYQWWYNQQGQAYDRTIIYNDNDDEDDDNSDRLDKKLCANSGVWNGNECIIEDEVEKAAYEDAVCDDPKNTKKYSNVCGGGDQTDKIYKDFEKEYKKQHPEYYPKAPVNPAEETRIGVSDEDSEKAKKFFEEESLREKTNTIAPSLKNVAGKNFDDVVKKNSNNNDDDDDNDKDTKSNDDNDDDNDDGDKKDKKEDKDNDNNDSDNDGGGGNKDSSD